MSDRNTSRALILRTDPGHATAPLADGDPAQDFSRPYATNRVPAKYLSQLINQRRRLAGNRHKRNLRLPLATRAYNTARYATLKAMPGGFNYEGEA